MSLAIFQKKLNHTSELRGPHDDRHRAATTANDMVACKLDLYERSLISSVSALAAVLPLVPKKIFKFTTFHC